MVDGGLLHVDTVIAEAESHFMHHPTIGCIEPLLRFLELREHNGNLQQGAGLHAEPVGGSGVV